MPDYLWVRDESLARRAALAPLLLAEGPYRLGAWLHRLLRGRRPVRLSVPVVSVGNLTVGGSAKTPVVGWLARELSAGGRKVAILSRGVGGRRGHLVNVVSDGRRLLLGAGDVGDEPVLLAGAVPGVPVLAGRNRVALGHRAAALFGAEVLLLDDGFQHHRLYRDLDVVCIDARLGLGNGHVLPRGPLREPRSALAHADAIVWTRAPADFDADRVEPRLVARLGPDVPQFTVSLEPTELRALLDGSTLPLSWLRDREVGVFAAIARPDRLRDGLARLGASIAELRGFPDHHLYTRGDLAGLAPGRSWITTAKDAVKIPPEWLEGRTVLVLEERLLPLGTGRLVAWLSDALDARPKGRR
jgi:tetraacyldisaccharide 4'-kinase